MRAGREVRPFLFSWSVSRPAGLAVRLPQLDPKIAVMTFADIEGDRNAETVCGADDLPGSADGPGRIGWGTDARSGVPAGHIEIHGHRRSQQVRRSNCHRGFA